MSKKRKKLSEKTQKTKQKTWINCDPRWKNKREKSSLEDSLHAIDGIFLIKIEPKELVYHLFWTTFISGSFDKFDDLTSLNRYLNYFEQK